MKISIGLLGAFVSMCVSQSAMAQWTNRYPKVEGYSHQLYLEQENLPVLSSGPVNPAPSPDGRHIAFSHQGWIWLLDLETGVARQFTNGAGMDGRPRWSPNSGTLAFVRDSGTDTSIILKRLGDGSEIVIDTPAIDLDPEFSADGNKLYYASAKAGRLSIWERELSTGLDTPFIEGKGLRRSARSLAGGSLVYHAMAYPSYSLRVLEADGETDRLLVEQGWMSHFDPDVHPTGRSMVYSVGDGNDLRLAVMDIDKPAFPRWLTRANRKALHPAFSADGSAIYFVEAEPDQQFALQRVRAAGGQPEKVTISRWDYIDPIGGVRISVTRPSGELAPARISITRSDGHPIANPVGPTFVDNNHGNPYFYSPGKLDLRLPSGRYRVVATRGPFSTPAEEIIEVGRGEITSLTLSIPEIWNPEKSGYASADHHVHLNASGVHKLELEDLLLPMQGEALDTAAPMAWNQYNRFVDAERVGEKNSAEDGTVAMLSQEVRSDFHGHVGAIGLEEAFHPWFFGPKIPTYVTRDVNNGQVMAHVHSHGALATYVHPIDGPSDPFADLEANPLPYELVLDGVLSDGVGLEIVCQWTSALGTSEVWYRFLNIGKAMPATAGTDMMANFYRAPAIGTARAYVPVAKRERLFEAVVEGVRKGSGFVTTGPALIFKVASGSPGNTVAAGRQTWKLELTSVKPIEKLELLVNGRVVQTLEGFVGNGSKTYSGTVDLPEGGWIAARALGGETGWPSMTVFNFAHSSPVWIGEIGSTEPEASKRAAADLLRALAHAELEFAKGYDGVMPPSLATRILDARRELEALAE